MNWKGATQAMTQKLVKYHLNGRMRQASTVRNILEAWAVNVICVSNKGHIEPSDSLYPEAVSVLETERSDSVFLEDKSSFPF
uniref:Uncharacterized protein n=1 Tax=Cannabis sativa TaxID=3483 RepID=A0A803PSE4_CANSA